MRRIYSDQTKVYLGIIFCRFDVVWYSEDRRGVLKKHDIEAQAIARLERQAEHRLTEAVAA